MRKTQRDGELASFVLTFRDGDNMHALLRWFFGDVKKKLSLESEIDEVFFGGSVVFY